jgi:hypothetical protein
MSLRKDFSVGSVSHVHISEARALTLKQILIIVIFIFMIPAGEFLFVVYNYYTIIVLLHNSKRVEQYYNCTL